MTERQGSENRILPADRTATKRFSAVLLAALAVMWVAAILVNRIYGTQWFSALNAAGSVSLTLVLVILYFRQSKILESQQDLLTAELNREVRQEHTETLRKRIREWHGNIDFDDPNQNPWDQPDNNLPSVNIASFESAPRGRVSGGSGDGFSAIPSHLRNDRYFKDLLKNHAPELRKQARAIEYLQFEFEQEKSQFVRNFNHLKSKDTENYTLEHDEYLLEWIFEELIKLNRNSGDDFEETKQKMLDQISESSEYRDGPIIWVRRKRGSISTAVYGAHYSEEEDLPPRDQHDQHVEEVRELVSEALEEIEENSPLDGIKKASKLLIMGSAAVTDLQHKLVEYDGRVVYPGECDYLREAEIGSDKS